MCVCVDMYNTSSSSSCVCVGFHQERATSYVNWNHHHGKCIISWLIAKFRGLSLRDSCIFKSIRNRRRRGGTDIRHNHQLLLTGWTCWQLFLLFVGRIFVFFNCCWTLERWTFVSFLSATTFHLNRTTSIVPWRVVVVVVGFPAQHFQKSLFLWFSRGNQAVRTGMWHFTGKFPLKILMNCQNSIAFYCQSLFRWKVARDLSTLYRSLRVSTVFQHPPRKNKWKTIKTKRPPLFLIFLSV